MEEFDEMLDEETDPSFSSSDIEEEDGLDLPNEFQPVAMPSAESQPIEMKKTGKAQGIADKFALKKLKLLKVKIIISAVVVFFVFIILSAIFSKEMEVKYDYIAPTCSQVTIRYRHRSEQDITLGLENYVESMVYSLTKNMRFPSRILYQAIAMVVRTNAQSLTNCTLSVSDEVDAYYNFEVIQDDNGRYEEISQAVANVQSLVMVQNQQFVKTDFDSFCYRSMDEKEYKIYNSLYSGVNVPREWVEQEINNFYYRNCSCSPSLTRSTVKANECWVEEKYPTSSDEEEDITYYRYVDGGGSGNAFSVYTAYYLARELGYDDEHLLRFFYPTNWDYYTLDLEKAEEEDLNGTLSCSYIDFMKTPLSKSEFVSLVQAYLGGKSSQTARLFMQYAEEIYDAGVSVGANPEMVYIVAEKEQGWKDSSFALRCHNYYGMGVYNGMNSGKCYANFMDGVMGMLAYIKGKGNLEAFTKVYSYLGTYLANPGSSGDGGCYYLTLNDIYGKNYSRCNSSYRCASSKGGPGCVLTTEAEKNAYIDWQASKILKIRSNIFHLSSEDCSISNAFGANVVVGDAANVDLGARMKWLFPSSVPKTQGEVQAYLTTISVPVVDTDGSKSNMSLTVHKKLAKEIEAIFAEMAAIGFPIHSAGGFTYRNMASGTGSLSHHSYGVAIDINAAENKAIYQGSVDKDSPYYITSQVVNIWKKHGFYWGGDWKGNYYDPMHFTYTNH